VVTREVCAGELRSWSKINHNKLKSYIDECRKSLNVCGNQGNTYDLQQHASL